ncbi:MAG: hypothetical protein ACK5C5_11490 [Bacteroidota bacterium]
MKKTVFCIFYVLLSWGISRGQTPIFQVTHSNCYGGSLEEDFFHSTRTSDGGYLLTGLSDSQDGDINQSVIYDTTNVFVVKTDSLGNKQWAKIYGGNNYDKGRFGMEDANGNYLIVGTTLSTDGDVVANHANSEVFVMKLNSLGDIIWLRTYGGNGFESARCILQTSDGNYLIGAYTTSPGGDVNAPHRGEHDGWIFKTDTAGNIIWSTTYGGSETDRIRWIEPLADGGYMFIGSTMSSDIDCIGNHGDHDFWIGRIDSIGTLIWSKVYGGSGPEWAYHLLAEPDSTWLVTGFTGSNNNGDVSGFKGGATDGWVIRLDADGNLLGQKCLGGSLDDRLNRSIHGFQNNILSVGFSQSNDMDLQSLNPGGKYSFWVCSLDSTLSSDWSYCTGGNLGDFGEEIFYSGSSNSITLVGETNSYDGITSSNHGGLDMLFIRLEVTGFSSTNFTETSPAQVHYDANSHALILHGYASNKYINIELTDLNGRSICSMKNLISTEPITKILLPSNTLNKSGVFVTRITSAENEVVQKIAVIK